MMQTRLTAHPKMSSYHLQQVLRYSLPFIVFCTYFNLDPFAAHYKRVPCLGGSVR